MTSKSKFILYTERFLCFLFLLIAFTIPFNEKIPEISIWIVLISAVYFYSNKNVDWASLKAFKWVLITAAFFFVWVVSRSICLLSSVEINNIFRYTGVLFFPIFILSTSTFLKNEKRIRYILYAFLSANLIIALYSIVAAVVTGIYWDVRFMNHFPITWYPGVMAFTIPAIVFLLTGDKSSQSEKIGLWISMLVFFSCIYMASRRGIILSVICGVGVIAVIKVWSSRKLAYKVVMGAAIVLLSLFLITNPRFKAIKDYDGYKYDIRLTMWEAALKMGTDTPSGLLAGYGLEKGFAEYNERLRAIDYFPISMKENFNSTHNDYLDLFIMFGLVGLLLFISFFCVLLYQAIRKKNVFLISAIMMTSVQFFFGSYFFWLRTGKFSLFFLLSLFLVCEKYQKKNAVAKMA